MSNSTPTAFRGNRHKFFADVMLGTLARWLRILGFDTRYDNAIEDDDLVRSCLEGGRVALTRDRGLARRKVLEHCLLVQGDSLGEQLSEVLAYSGESVVEDLILTRCIECNLSIEEVEKTGIQEEVPAFVYQTQSVFRRCPGCRRLYWAGTHRERILERLQELIGPVEEYATGTTHFTAVSLEARRNRKPKIGEVSGTRIPHTSGESEWKL